MTETPNGPQDPQQHDQPMTPQPGRPPYAGPEWRRPDADATRPAYGPPAPQDGRSPHGAAPQDGQPAYGVAPEGGQPAYGAGPEGGQPVRGAGSVPQGAGEPVGPRYEGGQAAGPQEAGGSVGPWHDGPQAVGPQDANQPVGPRYQGVQAAAPQGVGPQVAGPQGPGGQPYGAPYGGQHGASRYQFGAPVGAPWPYQEPKRAGTGRRLVAAAALAAVLGGLAGGGAVALLDRNDTAVAASGITVQGGSAPAAATQAGSVEAAAATAMRSVVTLSVRGSQESGTGSGIVIRADGYILTNEHVTAVAAGGGTITVTFSDGSTAAATIVGQDKETDLAVVKVNKTGLAAATFADSDAVKVGQTVVAVGSPLGLDGTVTEGIVSALHRPTSGGSDNSAVIDALQTDAAINPGNSGGALVDLAGRVVGINQSIATAGSNSANPYQQGTTAGNIGIGFAIPADTAARVAGELITSGKATHAYLGVQTRSATDEQSGTSVGATIASVQAGGPAAGAGLKAGDVVTKVDDRVVGESEDLVATIRSYAPGTKVTLTVRRGSDTTTLTVTLGSDSQK